MLLWNTCKVEDLNLLIQGTEVAGCASFQLLNIPDGLERSRITGAVNRAQAGVQQQKQHPVTRLPAACACPRLGRKPYWLRGPVAVTGSFGRLPEHLGVVFGFLGFAFK